MREFPLNHSNTQVLMEFALPAEQRGVKLVFRDTPVRVWAIGLSLLSLAL